MILEFTKHSGKNGVEENTKQGQLSPLQGLRHLVIGYNVRYILRIPN